MSTPRIKAGKHFAWCRERNRARVYATDSTATDERHFSECLVCRPAMRSGCFLIPKTPMADPRSRCSRHIVGFARHNHSLRQLCGRSNNQPATAHSSCNGLIPFPLAQSIRLPYFKSPESSLMLAERFCGLGSQAQCDFGAWLRISARRAAQRRGALWSPVSIRLEIWSLAPDYTLLFYTELATLNALCAYRRRFS